MTASTVSASVGRSEAMIIACALAGWGNPLSGNDMSRDRAERITRSTLAEHTHDEVLSWQARVAPSEWTIRWRWAAAATDRLYRDVLDTSALPAEFDAAGESSTT